METIRQDIIDFISNFINVYSLYDENGEVTSDISIYTRLVLNKKMIIHVLDEEKKVRFVKDKNQDMEEVQEIIKHLKEIVEKHGYRLDIDGYRSLKESLGRMYGYGKTSYQQVGDTNPCKLIITHNRAVNKDYPSTRTNNIKKLVIQYGDQKVLFPSKLLVGARALCCHLDQGGDLIDRVSTNIITLSENICKLKAFRPLAENKDAVTQEVNFLSKHLKELLVPKCQARAKKKLNKTDVCKVVLVETYMDSIKEIQEAYSILANGMIPEFTLKETNGTFEQKLNEIAAVLNQPLFSSVMSRATENFKNKKATLHEITLIEQFLTKR